MRLCCNHNTALNLSPPGRDNLVFCTIRPSLLFPDLPPNTTPGRQRGRNRTDRSKDTNNAYINHFLPRRRAEKGPPKQSTSLSHFPLKK
ncbi:mold-specific M46 protein [Histoplasma capsulatum G186AR]|uniref:Mold-specific M46 protein n=1 Tax=Ajellomyces capsulatus TaxID=5037 RepID=A0A8H7Z183_AJECA|nr:mold-specific M46 protein [Histoplasma capsulatum]QSS68146.1 mold-specific M46 protein [Histoplasma capsulatum G186AR]